MIPHCANDGGTSRPRRLARDGRPGGLTPNPEPVPVQCAPASCDALGLEFYVGRRRTDLGDGPMLRSRDSPDRTDGGHEKTASDRTRRRVRGESSGARGADDVGHDRFGRTIAPLRAEYRTLNSDGRAWMLIRLVAAFLEIGTSAADDGKENK